MSLKIEIRLGEVVRVLDENDFLDVACVRSVDYHSCGYCVFANRAGECPFACSSEERTDKKEVIFVVVGGVKGGAE